MDCWANTELTLSELSVAVILSHLVHHAARNNAPENYLQSISLEQNQAHTKLVFYLAITVWMDVALHVA